MKHNNKNLGDQLPELVPELAKAAAEHDTVAMGALRFILKMFFWGCVVLVLAGGILVIWTLAGAKLIGG